MNEATAQTLFSNTVQMSPWGSGYEQGIKATIRAIQRSRDTSKSVNAPNAQLFRPDAALAIVVVSDAEETGPTTPENLIDLVKSTWGSAKPFAFHSIVIPESQYTTPNSEKSISADPCKDYRESQTHDGRTYHRLSELTGGIKGNACTEDYSSQLSAMGTATAELVNSVMLSCQPLDANSDGLVNHADVTVTGANGASIVDFTLNGTKLTFTNALPVGDNQISFYCAE